MCSHRLASCQTQNDFMRDWLPFRSEYLHELLNAEGRESNSRCSICNDSHGVIRCSDCFESPVFCRDCCLRSHGSLPFHRVQLWNGKCFLKSSLFEQGFVMHLGHGGSPCPMSSHQEWEDVLTVEMDLTKEMSGEQLNEEVEANPFQESQLTTLVLVHSSGIFQHHISWCICSDTSPRHIQLLRSGLFPASIKSPKSAFTFDVLDHFYIDAMECKTAAMSFFHKLRHFTNNTAPL